MAGITYEIDDKNIVEQIKSDAANVAAELIEVAKLKKGDIAKIDYKKDKYTLSVAKE